MGSDELFRAVRRYRGRAMIFAALALSLIFSNAAQGDEIVGTEAFPVSVTLVRLIANSPIYDQKHILVRGYLCHVDGDPEGDSLGLFIDKSDCKEGNYDKGVRVIVARGGGSRLKSGKVEVRGLYNDDTGFISTDYFITGNIEALSIDGLGERPRTR